jgi:thiol-disulfide isomerase/thioredoxin
MTQFIRVTVDDFEQTVAQQLAATPKVFVLFFGSEEAATGQSWCPDCVIADPLIRQAISKVSDAVLIEAPVGLRDAWKGNPTHPYRVKYNVPALPTLYHWSKVYSPS